MTERSKIEIFSDHRDALFGIAYRMIGVRADAEDVVQNAWLRWDEHADTVRHPTSWLSTTTTRLAIDSAKRAYRQRETYVGPWLPEPLYDQTSAALSTLPTERNPEESLLVVESLKLGFLKCLDLLTPLERAAYLLRNVYEMGYGELADALDRSEAASRKLVSRAGQKLKAPAPASAIPPPPSISLQTDGFEVVARFLSALSDNDVEAMTRALLENVSATTDSDGKRTAARRPIIGQRKVVAFMLGLAGKQSGEWHAEVVSSNGDIALKIISDGVLESVVIPVLRGRKISELLIYRNPDKLPS